MKEVTYRAQLTYGDWVALVKRARECGVKGTFAELVGQMVTIPEVVSQLVALTTNLSEDEFGAMPLADAGEVAGKAMRACGFFDAVPAFFQRLTEKAPLAPQP